MRHEIKDFGWALRWYFQKDRGTQYGPREVGNYDEAARILTKRPEYAEFLASQIGEKPGKTLEIAAGTGLVSQALFRKISDVTFTDISASALSVLSERLGNPPNVEQVDFHSLPYPDSTFDTIVCVGGYRYVDPARKQEFWGEMERVLTPSGRLLIGQFYPRAFPLRGVDIGTNGIQTSLQHRSLGQFQARIDLHPGSFTTGHYLTFEFAKGLNGAK